MLSAGGGGRLCVGGVEGGLTGRYEEIRRGGGVTGGRVMGWLEGAGIGEFGVDEASRGVGTDSGLESAL
jgi:hypothetical protein